MIVPGIRFSDWIYLLSSTTSSDADSTAQFVTLTGWRFVSRFGWIMDDDSLCLMLAVLMCRVRIRRPKWLHVLTVWRQVSRSARNTFCEYATNAPLNVSIGGHRPSYFIGYRKSWRLTERQCHVIIPAHLFVFKVNSMSLINSMFLAVLEGCTCPWQYSRAVLILCRQNPVSLYRKWIQFDQWQIHYCWRRGKHLFSSPWSGAPRVLNMKMFGFHSTIMPVIVHYDVSPRMDQPLNALRLLWPKIFSHSTTRIFAKLSWTVSQLSVHNFMFLLLPFMLLTLSSGKCVVV